MREIPIIFSYVSSKIYNTFARSACTMSRIISY